MKKIFVYTPQKEKMKKIEAAAKLCGISILQLSARDLNKTIGEITGIAGIGKAAGQKLQSPPLFAMPETMLMSGLSGADLDLFLEKYKQEGITPIHLKAVVTPYNISWTLYELILEMIKERSSITG